MPITAAPAVGVISSFWFESYDSNAGLSAFGWNHSDSAACGNIMRFERRF